MPCLYQNEPLTKPAPVGKPTPEVLVPALGCRKRPFSVHSMRSELASHRLSSPCLIIEIELMDILYMIDKIRTYPLMSIEQGGNPFIHPRLYQKFHKPYPLALIDRLCFENVDQLRPGSNGHADFLAEGIHSVLADQSRVTSFLECLAFVQALLTIQILTILSSSLSAEQRKAAEERQTVLAFWSQKLWSMAPAELPQHLLPCDAYILAESVRRTLLVAYALQALYTVITCGAFNHTVFGSALPFDANVELWEADCHQGQCKHATDTIDLISYRQYVERFDSGSIRRLSQFEKILLVACHGVASVEPGVELPAKSKA